MSGRSGQCCDAILRASARAAAPQCGRQNRTAALLRRSPQFVPAVQQRSIRNGRSGSTTAATPQQLDIIPPLSFPSSVGAISSVVEQRRKSPQAIDSLTDTFGRRHTYLRVSLTDRCNLRCAYCMPEEGEEPTQLPAPNGDLLTAAELKQLTSLFVRMGVRKIRLTGGEPTIRGDFAQIVHNLGELNAGLSKPLSIGITTNGVRLSRYLPNLRDARAENINLSLDTLVAAKFPLLCRRPASWHARILKLVDEVAAQDEHFRLKINCVVLKGVNEEEIGAFVDLTEHRNIEVRFLEFMPFDGNGWSNGRMVPQATILKTMHDHLEGRGFSGGAQRLPPDSLHDVAKLWKVPGWKGRIGVIASMTDAFCGGCNRIRLTSAGEIRNCLFGEEGWSLRDALRSGTDEEGMIETIAESVGRKFVKLGGKKDMNELRERAGKNLPMVALGG